MLEILKEKLLRGFTKSSDTPIDFTAKKFKFPLQRRDEKYRQMALMPKDGIVWNPVRAYPVNKGCFCASGVKAKKCCMPFLQPTVSKEFAAHIKQNWADLLTGRFTLPRAPGNK